MTRAELTREAEAKARGLAPWSTMHGSSIHGALALLPRPLLCDSCSCCNCRS